MAAASEKANALSMSKSFALDCQIFAVLRLLRRQHLKRKGPLFCAKVAQKEHRSAEGDVTIGLRVSSNLSWKVPRGEAAGGSAIT